MSNENVKNQLVNSMKATKAGTAKTTEAVETKEEAKAAKPEKKAAPKKKAAEPKKNAGGFSAGNCRVWPD